MKLAERNKKRLAHYGGWAVQLLLSAAAVYPAGRIAETEIFGQFSAIVSDQISRGVGQTEAPHVALVRITSTKSLDELSDLLIRGIPSLIRKYQAAAVGVDIDFSAGGVPKLAAAFGGSAQNGVAGRVTWAVRPQRGEETAPLADAGQRADPAACNDCGDASCRARLSRSFVFGEPGNEPDYGLALILPNPSDPYGISRWSPRFFCATNTQAPIDSFYFRLVEQYCDSNPSFATCSRLQEHRQAVTTLRAWHRQRPIDLCELIACAGAPPPKPENDPGKQIRGKVVLLYHDVPDNDEHVTFMGLQKGGDIVTSLIETELAHGAPPDWATWVVKWAIEITLAVVLLWLFHTRYAHYLAVPGAIIVFSFYLWLTPRLSAILPDFRDYVLAIMLTFFVEMYVKLIWISYHAKTEAHVAAAGEQAAPPVASPAPRH